MYINQIDDLFDNLLNKLFEYLNKNKLLQKYSSDTNFVKFQNDVFEKLKDFISKNVSKKEILDLVKNESYYEYILGTIKRYCAFYIYLGIAYYYHGSRDLYITNIIESSRNVKDSTFQIPNFYNSENNSKLINSFNDIKNILSIFALGKTMDKIKIILSNNPLRYDSTIKLFNDLGEDYIIDNFLIKDNLHNIIKTLIFKQIYIKEEKNDILNFLNQEEKEHGEYKYIEIIVSNEKKLVDFNQIQKFLSVDQLKAGLADEIYNYLVEMRETKEFIIRENQDFINFLFSKQILIPISEEFVRYHDDNEKYDPESLVGENLKDRDATKIKYIINKMNNVRNYYSPLLQKNPKLKLETEKFFHKSQDPRQAVLINENEELKIVQKLKMSENAADTDLLIDLENIRRYAFTNYKNLSKDGFKLRTAKTIQSIRSINLKKKKGPLELRIGHDNLELAVVGIAWNPSQMPLECFISDDLIDVNKLFKSENGYKSFTKIINKTFDTKNNQLYYWLFNNDKDIPDVKGYADLNKDDSSKNIKIMISEIYNQYIDLIKKKYESYIKNLTEISIWNMDNILKGYANKYFDFNLNPEIRNQLIESTLEKRLKEIKVEDDDVDSMMPGKRNKIIELPKLIITEKKKNLININSDSEEDIVLDQNINEPICLHYIKWKNISKLAKSKTDDFSQAVVDFAKQYVKINKSGDYICKSCNEILSLKKYIYEGTYVEELDTFMTTNIAVNQRLEEIPKYSKFMRTIRNLEKNIEKIAYSSDLMSYLGTSPTIRLRRKLIIKDVLDMILLHTEYLRKQPKDRIEQANKKYNINKDFTNLFFFELKDEIFLTSSTDTDYYKLIKYNNIIAYLLFMMILDLNPGQLLGLKDDKRCNYFFYEKFGDQIFSDLFLRLNQKEKIPITKIPLLCYAIFYFSCIFTNNRIWLWNENKEEKNKLFTNINVQKTIINTLVDLINTMVEANFEKDKNYLYDFINTRFNQKLTYTFNDTNLMKLIKDRSSKNVNYDQNTKKITFRTNKIESISIAKDIEEYLDEKSKIKLRCDTKIKEIELIETTINNNLDLLTNCSSGKFHKWEYQKGDMICKLCQQSYNELIKLLQTSTATQQDDNKNYIRKLTMINLNKLAKKYCITGEVHDLNEKGVCIKCKKNPNEYNFSDKELLTMNTNIEEKTYESNIEAFKLMKKYLEQKEEMVNKTKTIINKFNSRYEENTNNKLKEYVLDFVDRLIKVLGPKIKVNDETIYLKETVFTIDHDYLGNLMKEKIIILSSDQKIEIYRNHPHYKRDVLYYKDKANNVFVYYDFITLQYLGYSENNKEYKKSKVSASLVVTLSIKDCILLLGLQNQFMNIYHINAEYQKLPLDKLKDESENITNNYLRTRVNNLKQIVSRIQSIINNIKNNGRNNSIYSSEEKVLVDEFTKKIKNFNTRTPDGHDAVFKHWRIISNNIGINKIPENISLNISKNYFDTVTLNNLNNSDCKTIFYLIYNFNRLLDYNTQLALQSELSHLIIRLIKYSFNQYFRPYSDTQVRKFDFILINETPYIDDSLKVVGFYQELLNSKEIDDQNQKQRDDNTDAKEAFESMDVDDYEVDDDVDGTMEAYDGPEQ
jgi:hypothetical protein